MTLTTTTSTRTRRPRPKLVTLTDAAAARVREILDERGQGFLRVGVTNGGCAGMEYVMDYVSEMNMSWTMSPKLKNSTKLSRIKTCRLWSMPKRFCLSSALLSIMRLIRCPQNSLSKPRSKPMLVAAA